MDPKVAAPFNFEGPGLPWEAEPWMQFLVNSIKHLMILALFA
jgi:hypothetical protein